MKTLFSTHEQDNDDVRAALITAASYHRHSQFEHSLRWLRHAAQLAAENGQPSRSRELQTLARQLDELVTAPTHRAKPGSTPLSPHSPARDTLDSMVATHRSPLMPSKPGAPPSPSQRLRLDSPAGLTVPAHTLRTPEVASATANWQPYQNKAPASSRPLPPPPRRQRPTGQRGARLASTPRPPNSRQLDSRQLDSRQLDSRQLDSRQLDSRQPDSPMPQSERANRRRTTIKQSVVRRPIIGPDGTHPPNSSRPLPAPPSTRQPLSQPPLSQPPPSQQPSSQRPPSVLGRALISAPSTAPEAGAANIRDTQSNDELAIVDESTHNSNPGRAGAATGGFRRSHLPDERSVQDTHVDDGDPDDDATTLTTQAPMHVAVVESADGSIRLVSTDSGVSAPVGAIQALVIPVNSEDRARLRHMLHRHRD